MKNPIIQSLITSLLTCLIVLGGYSFLQNQNVLGYAQRFVSNPFIETITGNGNNLTGVGTASTTNLLVDQKIGVATTVPGYALDVNGTVQMGTGLTTMVVDSNGYIGIGTATPAYQLDVQGTVGIGTGTVALKIDSTGYVGIGTTSPDNVLDVTTQTAAATTSTTFGQAGQGKGWCIKTYNTAGTLTYCSISGTTFSCSTNSCL